MKKPTIKKAISTLPFILSIMIITACGASSNKSNSRAEIEDNTHPPTKVTPPIIGDGQIRVLSNRSDLISGGNALLEITVADSNHLKGIIVEAADEDISDSFKIRNDGRLIGLVENLTLGENTVVATLTDGSTLNTTIINHPNGGPVFSGPQIQPWTCTNIAAVDDQCNQPAEFSFQYVPADKLKSILTNFDPTSMELPPAFLPYDVENPPADSEIAMVTTDNGEELPFIVRV